MQISGFNHLNTGQIFINSAQFYKNDKDLEPFVKAMYRILEPFQQNGSNPLIGTFIQ